MCDEHGNPKWELCVPAWLMLNSMHMEGLQFLQLNTQELHNIWRKQALTYLVQSVEARLPADFEELYNSENPGAGVGRFSGPDGQKLSDCVAQFREPVDFDVPSTIPEHKRLSDQINTLASEHEKFLKGDAAQERLQIVLGRAARSAPQEDKAPDASSAPLDQLMEQEQEQVTASCHLASL